jgi:mannose-6-phosphate isomerase-like protein (cupin superfamily)
MQKSAVGGIAVLLVGGALVTAQDSGGAGRSGAAPQGRGGDAGTTILEQAPADHSIAIPKEKLSQYFKDMDARKLSTLRLIEGGKYNVNIRRITNAETALVHPATIDLWVVLEGSGTLTAGGHLEKGKILNGVPYPLRVGDIAFIPANLPHGVSGVNGNITWLNVRWDTDWPAGAELGAGNLPGARAGGPAAGGTAPLAYAGSGAVYIPKETLDAYLKDMAARKIATLRMIEGGHFNINIRRIDAPSVELHPVTIDTWVVLEGGGTANTHYDRTADGQRVPGTGVSVPARVGDVFFIPANLTHGFSTVNNVMTWLNIRWDVNWAKSQL